MALSSAERGVRGMGDDMVAGAMEALHMDGVEWLGASEITDFIIGAIYGNHPPFQRMTIRKHVYRFFRNHPRLVIRDERGYMLDSDYWR